MNRMIAAILAGGRGTRMDILCHVRPKPALPFAGKYRVIDFSLSNCTLSGIDTMALFVDYQSSHLTKYLGRWQNENPIRTPLDILEPVLNDHYMGTADALYQNLDYLRGQPADRVLIMPSDQAYKMDYRKMLAFHEESGAEITIGAVPVPMEEANRFGILVTDRDGRVTEYDEKPDMPESNLASMGIYIFNKDVLIERLTEDALQPASIHDFGYSIIPGVVGRDRVYAYRFDGFWRDIGTVDAYYATSMELISAPPRFSLNGSWPILTGTKGKPARIFGSGRVKNSIIGPGCVIKGRVENSILSPGVRVDERSVVRNSVLLPRVFVRSHSTVDSCIIDEDANIGEYCYIGLPGCNNRMPEYTLLGKGANIASCTYVMRGYKVMPYARSAERGGKVSVTEYPPAETVQPPNRRSSHEKIEA